MDTTLLFWEPGNGVENGSHHMIEAVRARNE